jgi:Kef-type K+ transport system membrane component KefB
MSDILQLNLKLIKEVGFISMITGVGQVLFTSIIGMGISYIMGYSLISSFLIAIALTFSSTIIIVKLLSDKKDLNTLYGKISMGFLIIQDLIAVILLMVLSSYIGNAQMSTSQIIIKTVLFILASLILTYVLSKFAIPKFLKSISKSNELLFLFVITWCLGISSLFYFAGFSLEVGALLAGVVLASTPYQYEISARIKPLRDFFIVMFFILLGSQMLPVVDNSHELDFAEKMGIISETFLPILFPAIVFSLFVLIGNPLIVLILMTRLGYSSKTGFLAGLTVAQISEFSLIIAMMGKEAGLLTASEVSMITLVGIITITSSTYMILGGNSICNKFQPFLKKFEPKKTKDKKVSTNTKKCDVLIFGYDRIGYSLLETIHKLKKDYLVIDYNPDTIKKLEKRKVNCMYGDANNIELLDELDMGSVEILISTIPDYEINTMILKQFRKYNKTATIILTSNLIDNALDLYSQGADYVILPHFLGGNYVSTLIENINLVHYQLN